MMDEGVKPRSIAAVYTIGLKVDPSCRYACTARLNLLRVKLQPPTMALIWPVWLSMARIAPSASGDCSSVTVAAPVAASIFAIATSTRSPGLKRSAADTLRVHA